jgi:hypothetical protein
MSYDIYLRNKDGSTCQMPERHDIRGGTYCVGTVAEFPEGRYLFPGTTECWLNVTYNYAKFYYEHLDEENGIRVLYGKTGAECIPLLEKAIAALGTQTTSDYWAVTPGNAGAALQGLLQFAVACPDGVFEGD